MRELKTKKLAYLSLAVALSMVLSFVESQIPPLAAVPGVKLGLANIVTVFLIYTVGWKEAGGVSIIRVALSSLLFGSAVSFIYSASGAFVSFFGMLLLKKTGKFSEIGVSVTGGVLHNGAQILAACIVMDNAAISLWLPPLIISGTLSGIFVGILAALLAKRLKGKIK